MTSTELASTRGPARSVASLDQQVDVETPEQVVLSYTLAGVGARAAAAIIDFVAISFIIIAFVISMSLLAKLGQSGPKPTPEESSTWAVAIFILVIFALEWGYYVLFEALWDGQTPGKRLLHIRVVQDGGYSVSFGASAVRNIARIIDGQPGFAYGVGVVAAALNKSGKRLGDMMAGTFVVQERIEQAPVIAPVTASTQGDAPATSSLSASEYELLERFLSRAPSLAPERLVLLADRLSVKLAAHMPTTRCRCSTGCAYCMCVSARRDRAGWLREVRRAPRASDMRSWPVHPRAGAPSPPCCATRSGAGCDTCPKAR